MKRLLKGFLLLLSLFVLAACESPIDAGTIINKHKTEAHKEMGVMMIGDTPFYFEDEIPDKYYFDVNGKDKDGREHTVTVQVDEEAYDHHKVGDHWRITIKS